MTDLSEHGAVVTKQGLEKAQEELALLINVKRLEVSEKIKSAKEMGDLSENAEYHAAKEEQAFIESRIKELEHLIKYASVTAGPTDPSAVEVGNTVVIKGKNGEKTYVVVGFNEADPSAGRISNESPLGKSIMGKRVGDKVSYVTPGGTIEVEIISIS